MSRAESSNGTTGPPDTLYPCGGTAFDLQNALTSGSGAGLQMLRASWKSAVARLRFRNVAGATVSTVTWTPAAASSVATSWATTGRGSMAGTLRVNASCVGPFWRAPYGP